MKTHYITDTSGNKISVILPIKEYEKIMNDLEELKDIKACDRAKARKSEAIPFDQAVKEIELLRYGNV